MRNQKLLSLVWKFVFVLSIVVTGSVESKAIGVECGEVDGDCFTRGYVGMTVGGAKWSNQVLKNSATQIDDSDIGYGIVGGYRFNKFIGLEAFINSLGEPDYKIGTSKVSVSAYNTGAGVNWYLPLGSVISDNDLDFISFLGRVGMQYWDAQFKSGGTYIFDDHGFDLFWGAGLNVDFNRYVTGRVDYTKYSINSDNVGTTSLTVVYKF